jgi:ketosteroid isomerase-like protein
MADNNCMNVLLICLGLTILSSVYSCSPALIDQIDIFASEVEAREIAFAKTMADRNFKAFLEFVSPEAVFFRGNEPQRGHDAVSQAWAPFFEGETAPFSWHPDVIEVLESGHLALSSGPVRAASGEIVGRFNSIWRKDEDGQWRIVFDKGS